MRIRVVPAEHEDAVWHLNTNIRLRAAGVAAVENGHGAIMHGRIVFRLVIPQSSHRYIQTCRSAWALAQSLTFTSG